MTRGILVTMVLALVLLAACDSDEGAGTPSTTATVSVPPRETPTPTPSATPVVEIQHTVWLLNLWEGERHTIYEHPDFPPGDVGFVRGRVAGVTRGSGAATYGSNGRPGGGVSLPCKQVPGVAASRSGRSASTRFRSAGKPRLMAGACSIGCRVPRRRSRAAMRSTRGTSGCSTYLDTKVGTGSSRETS